MPLHQQEEFTKLPRVIFTHKRHDIIEKSVDLRIFVVFHERDPVADLSVSVMRDESRVVDQLPQTAFQVGEQPVQILFIGIRHSEDPAVDSLRTDLKVICQLIDTIIISIPISCVTEVIICVRL